MAGQAAKKREKTALVSSTRYRWTVIIAMVLHLSNVILRSAASKWDYAGVLFLAGVFYWSFGGLCKAMTIGIDYSFYQDIFIANGTVAILTIVSKKCWLLYLSVPAYAIYKIGGPILQFCMASNSSGEEDSNAQDKKQKKQKERVKFVRH